MKLSRLLFWVGVFSLLVAIYATVYVSMHSRQTKTLSQKIVYFPDKGDKLPIFFIKNLKFREDYVDYVNYQLNDRIHEPIKFPHHNGLAFGDTIYIRKYLKDSALVEFYCPKYHDQIWGLRTGYIHRALIHDALKSE
jgi:hypothetical protein